MQVAVFVGNMRGGDDDVTAAVPLEDGEYNNMLVGAETTECRALQVKGGQVRGGGKGKDCSCTVGKGEQGDLLCRARLQRASAFQSEKWRAIMTAGGGARAVLRGG